MDVPAAQATTTSFDAHAAAVYRVACHLTVGRQDDAEALLVETFVSLRRTLTRGDEIAPADVGTRLILDAHRLHLVSADHDHDDGRDDDHGAVVGGWAGPLDVLGSMPPVQRVLLSLVDVEHVPSAVAADLTAAHRTAEMDELLTSARATLAASGTADVAAAFAATELWFDDYQRAALADRLTVAAASPSEPPVSPNATPSGSTHARVGTPRRTATALAVVACVAIAALGWIVTRPNGTTSSAAPGIPVNTASGSASGATSGTTVGESVVIPLASGLGDERTIRPDTIVRFSNGRVGLTWTGPCNRPATSVRFTNTRYGVELQLSTGSFFVVSCVGMPTAWTATVTLPAGIADGRIVPTMAGAGLATTFSGYSESDATTSETSLHANGSATFSSALLDADLRAWAFVQDCSSLDRIRYPDHYFEIRLGQPATTCPSIDRTPRLVGPGGQQFPYLPHRDGGSTGVPADCSGPSGSATDVTTVVGTRAPAVGDDDLVVTTWDGCSVRPGAVSAAHLSAASGWDSATVVSFGDPIGAPIVGSGRRFIGDPDGVVPNQVAPMLPSVQMPADSDDSGIRIGGAPVFISSTVPQAVFVVTDHGVQRWPAFTTPPYCDGIRG